MKLLSLFAGLCSVILFTTPAFSQPSSLVADTDSSSSFAQTIQPEDLRAHLSILASDEFEGRETGTPGNKKAAMYIAEQFKSFGLKAVGENNSYFQPVAFTWTMWDQNELEVKGKTYRHLWDYISFPDLSANLPELKSKKVLFLGFGIDDPKYSDYDGVDTEGAVILIYKGEPRTEQGISQITGTAETSDWSDNLERKLRVAKANGVAAVFIIEDDLQKKLSENRRFLLNPLFSLGRPSTKGDSLANHFLISTTIAREIMGKRFDKVVSARDKANSEGKAGMVKLKAPMRMLQQKEVKTLEGENVLGYLPGKDPKKKKELIVVTAHYDHLGKRGNSIYNGADDNGSGTSTVIEVAQAFAEAQKAAKDQIGASFLCWLPGKKRAC